MKPGHVIAGRFEYERDLGEGGQGATFLAFDREVEAKVALKRLHFGHMEDWKALELFEREGEALRALNHASIPRYIAAVRTDDALYLAQEYVAGETLDALIARPGALGLEDALSLARAMLDTLAYLHGRTPPVIHRDLKPSNIIKRSDGGWSLIDFGAVQAAIATATSVGTTVVGTAGYMPPEQAVGRAVPATDLYALGATLVHALTGMHPDGIALDRMRFDFRPLLSDADPRVLAWLERLVEPHIEDRFGSAAEARQALGQLERALASGEAPLRPASRETAIVVAVGAFLVLGGAALVAIYMANEPVHVDTSNDPGSRFLETPPTPSAPVSPLAGSPLFPPATPPEVEPTPEPEPAPVPEPAPTVEPITGPDDPLMEDPHRKPVKMPWTRRKLNAELVHARPDLLGLELVAVTPDGVMLRNGSERELRSITFDIRLLDRGGELVWSDTPNAMDFRSPSVRPGDVLTVTHHRGAKLKKAGRGRVDVVVREAATMPRPEGGYPEPVTVPVTWPAGRPKGVAVSAFERSSAPSHDECKHDVVVENTGDRSLDTLILEPVRTDGVDGRSVSANVYYDPVIEPGQRRHVRVHAPCGPLALKVVRVEADD